MRLSLTRKEWLLALAAVVLLLVAVLAATGELLSGYSLKHVVAAFAAWPILQALAARTQGQNAATTDAAPLARARRA